MAGCYIFTASSNKRNIRKTGKPPEGSNELMDVFSLTPNGVYYSVGVYVCVS